MALSLTVVLTAVSESAEMMAELPVPFSGT